MYNKRILCKERNEKLVEGEGNGRQKSELLMGLVYVPLFSGMNGRSITNLYHSTVLNDNDIFP